MIRPSRWSRLVTMLFAAAQFALPASLSIGDAIASNDGRAARSHVEDTTRAGCKTPHADDCTVCRYLTALAAPACPDAPRIPRLMRGELTGLARASGGSPRAHGFLSRAPPGLSA